jgi:hypothetical protein
MVRSSCLALEHEILLLFSTSGPILPYLQPKPAATTGGELS